MKRDFNNDSDGGNFFYDDITGPNGPSFISSPLDSDDKLDSDDFCGMSDTFFALMTMDKPFGILFSTERIERFLKARGYTLADRYFSHIGDDVKVAIKLKDGESVNTAIADTPEDAAKYHIRAIFSSEVQEILLKWLLKIGK